MMYAQARRCPSTRRPAPIVRLRSHCRPQHALLAWYPGLMTTNVCGHLQGGVARSARVRAADRAIQHRMRFVSESALPLPRDDANAQAIENRPRHHLRRVGDDHGCSQYTRPFQNIIGRRAQVWALIASATPHPKRRTPRATAPQSPSGARVGAQPGPGRWSSPGRGRRRRYRSRRT